MKRGLITWDKSEIAREVFEQRVRRVGRVLAERELPALDLYGYELCPPGVEVAQAAAAIPSLDPGAMLLAEFDAAAARPKSRPWWVAGAAIAAGMLLTSISGIGRSRALRTALASSL